MKPLAPRIYTFLNIIFANFTTISSGAELANANLNTSIKNDQFEEGHPLETAHSRVSLVPLGVAITASGAANALLSGKPPARARNTLLIGALAGLGAKLATSWLYSKPPCESASAIPDAHKKTKENIINFKEAIFNENYDIALDLLESKRLSADQKTPQGYPLICFAAEFNALPVVKKLLEMGADVMAETIERQNAISIAESLGYVDLKNLLLKETNANYRLELCRPSALEILPPAEDIFERDLPLSLVSDARSALSNNDMDDMPL